ncbi:MAG TPA: PA14 domain-containing protein [Puia sp.]|nr:PA14 domain-containing protein [Puia sp.]
MILALATRFQKYIALFLYSVFYSQLIFAAESLRGSGSPDYPAAQRRAYVPERRVTPPPAANVSNGISKATRQESRGGEDGVEEGRDSLVKPEWHPSPVKNISVSIPSRPAQPAKAFIGGPSQPEMQSFQSVNSNNMVDLFTGDFAYNIPLLDVGGYPVNIAYHSGRSMDEDASWVGLGWNINPGSITRDMRGLPDDFSGGADTIKKVSSVKPNVNLGITAGGNVEIDGCPVGLGLSGGIFHTTYAGWGMETGINASLNAGAKSFGNLSGGLSVTNNSQNGISINPSLSYQAYANKATDVAGAAFGAQLSTSYNSRTGLKDIHLGLTTAGVMKLKNGKRSSFAQGEPSGISFAWPTYTPTISLPMSNYNYSFTFKIGGEVTVFHYSLYGSGYYGKEYIAASDKSQSLPAYGYLNFQNRSGNWAALTDFNREKELPYREKPAIPHIAVPAYTYDVFNISGEGTGGMFRAYRGDIGFISDHLISNKSQSGAGSVDIGAGDDFHVGVDQNVNYSVTQSGPWIPENPLGNIINFQKSNGLFEAAYFRNPGEKTINTTDFYNAIGGDNVVVPSLSQSGSSIATNQYLRLVSGQKQMGIDTLTAAKAIKNTRDKRSQVISYLTATEASVVGLDKYINRYNVNQFGHYCENYASPDPAGKGTGLVGYYFNNRQLKGTPIHIEQDTFAFFNWGKGSPFWHNDDGVKVTTDHSFPTDNFSVRWLGRLKAPATGTYTFGIYSDDGVRLWIGDSLVIDDWKTHTNAWNTVQLNLVSGTLYNIRLEYFEAGGNAFCQWGWKRPDRPNDEFDQNRKDTVESPYLYPPIFTDTVPVNPILTREDRVNNFRKANHISEIDVLNADGRKYVYGIPVYNLLQKEVSFSVDAGDAGTGLASYDSTQNSTDNQSGKTGYYSREEIPAYAHSFLLTGILSPDYVDVTGDGISDDDIGDAVRFDYSKTSGVANSYGWRAPYVMGKANYNEGFRSYNRDDKANYIYGKKELWYLHTIESKTMIATFTLQPRSDLLDIDENGVKSNTGKAMCLKEINLYSKADFLSHGTTAIPIKTVHFEYSYELCRGVSSNSPSAGSDSGKLTLKRIWFTYNGNNKGVLNPYVFNYHSNNPNYQTSMSDKWGTYKDPIQNPGSTSSNVLTNAEYPYALQDSTLAAANAGAWNLDSIQLPSGGRIKVKYESDDYAFVQNRRATQMCTIAGIAMDNQGGYNNKLYNFFKGDGLYVYIKVPYAVTTPKEVYSRYLEGIGKLFFRLFVTMPKDDFGSGSEYIPCYAEPDTTIKNWYGVLSADHNTIWVKVKGVNKTGDGDGVYSPLAQTAINFLRLNLPSKAYPGSELNDNITPMDAVKILFSQVANVLDLMNGFTNTARGFGWCSTIDVTRSFVRMDCPILKKLGGGLRVKSILIYDNWKAMANKKETVYGQTYDYTTTRSVNGVNTTISSGVASWEPAVGSEENPFHLPIEYVERTSVLAPGALQYTEEPLGEAFYPAPSIGYSKVSVRSIHTGKTRSANGHTETTFFTSYDFPTSWDWSTIDNDTKKRYKPLLNNLLRINAKSYLTLSQGFKIELNDMNGKLRSEASYPETDTAGPISYTENFYKVDDGTAQFKHLRNTVTTIDPFGNIDSNATIGKDAELMTDMRDQTSSSTGANVNVNVDVFTVGVIPVVIPSLIPLYQHETTQFRSVAMTKIIQRYGILDSVVHIDKGSKVTSKNLLYDAETGDPLLVMTLNEFNDSIYQFTYPSHWMYPGTGPAYWNIDAQLSHLDIDHGKLKYIDDSVLHIKDSLFPATTYLSAGDELLVYSKQTFSTPDCNKFNATFRDSYKLWVIDTNLVHNGAPDLFLEDKDGNPFSGHDVNLKVIRSGHRNLGSTVGTVASLGNPLVRDGQNNYHLVFDTTTQVVSAGASELQQLWKVADKRKSNILTSCINTSQDSSAAAQGCSCLRPFFDYLISSHNLFMPFSPRVLHWTVRRLVDSANAHGANIVLDDCPILKNNADLNFKALSVDSNGTMYEAVLGNDIVDIRSISGGPMHLFSLVSKGCDSLGRVIYKDTSAAVAPPTDTVTVNIRSAFSANLFSSLRSTCKYYMDDLLQADTISDHLMTENGLVANGYYRNAASILRFDHLNINLPVNAQIVSANLLLQADQRGHIPGAYNNSNSVFPSDSVGVSLSAPAGWFPYQPLDTMLYQAYFTNWFGGGKNTTAFQDLSVDVTDYLSGYISGIYTSSTFVLTQGSRGLHIGGYDSAMVANHAVPPYLISGYSNYYATYYNQRYADSTKWPVIQVKYVTPQGFTDTLGAVLEYNSSVACTTVYGRSCYSAITDTLVNPYQYAVLGDFRPERSYAYYGRRKESDPADKTVSIRTAGVIKNFAPFWMLQSGHWLPSYDTTRWVWNSQTTLFNRKGFELENKDPLGRYNAGLYGYGLTLPTAVIQNSRYQESAFEGFEDYGYIASSCDSLCPEARPFDFSFYQSNISDSMAHTGLYSLRVQKDSSISLIGLKIAATPDLSSPQLTDSLYLDNCTSTSRLAGLKASSNTVLPSFTPFAGKKMLVSAWVKEENTCTCQAYSRNHILINFSLSGAGTSAISLTPSGNMIEGWQRFETVVNIPSNATAMTLTLQASDSSTTYFDDIRLLPFNAEMKSYVYNPVNLRLMAELDENNYATFYEYDDDGTLIRVKKETERGIQTIKETHSALLKDQQ